MKIECILIYKFYLWALKRFVWYQFPLEYHFFSPLHFQPLWHSYYPHSTSLYTRDYNLLNHKNCCCLNKFMSVVDIFDFVVFKFYHIAMQLKMLPSLMNCGSGKFEAGKKLQYNQMWHMCQIKRDSSLCLINYFCI